MIFQLIFLKNSQEESKMQEYEKQETRPKNIEHKFDVKVSTAVCRIFKLKRSWARKSRRKNKRVYIVIG